MILNIKHKITTPFLGLFFCVTVRIILKFKNIGLSIYAHCFTSALHNNGRLPYAKLIFGNVFSFAYNSPTVLFTHTDTALACIENCPIQRPNKFYKLNISFALKIARMVLPSLISPLTHILYAVLKGIFSAVTNSSSSGCTFPGFNPVAANR